MTHDQKPPDLARKLQIFSETILCVCDKNRISEPKIELYEHYTTKSKTGSSSNFRTDLFIINAVRNNTATDIN